MTTMTLSWGLREVILTLMKSFRRYRKTYVAAAGLNSIRERWAQKKNSKKPIRVCFERPVVRRLSSAVWWSSTDFFEFQSHLLESYPEEAGSVRGFVRIIPYLPGIINISHFRERLNAREHGRRVQAFWGEGPWLPSRLSLEKTMPIKLIFTRKIFHLALFWKWKFLELWNSLLVC